MNTFTIRREYGMWLALPTMNGVCIGPCASLDALYTLIFQQVGACTCTLEVRA